MAFSQNNHVVTAILPENKLIWPLPEIDTDRSVFLLQTDFISKKEILSVVQGNWKTTTYLVTYRVLKEDRRYPYQNLTFVVTDKWPTKESQIDVKKLPWPFKEGENIFYLTKDVSCSYKQFFKILSYSKYN